MEQQAQILSEIYTAAKEGDDAAFYPQKFRPVLLPKELYVSATSPELSGEEGIWRENKSGETLTKILLFYGGGVTS